MLSVIKVVIGILVFLFGFYMFLDDSGREMQTKLTKQEKRYLDILEIWFYVSVMAITAFMIGPFFE